MAPSAVLDDESVPSSAPDDPERRHRVLVTALAVAAVVALVAAVVGGIYWWTGTYSTTAERAAARDAAVDAAEQITVNINTVRPGSLQQDLATAQQSMTDPMLTEFGKVRQQFADALARQQASVEATPAGAALTAFDADQGTASAIVAISVTAQSTTTQPTEKQQLFQIEMQRTPEGWKAAKAAPATAQG